MAIDKRHSFRFSNAEIADWRLRAEETHGGNLTAFIRDTLNRAIEQHQQLDRIERKIERLIKKLN